MSCLQMHQYLTELHFLDRHAHDSEEKQKDEERLFKDVSLIDCLSQDDRFLSFNQFSSMLFNSVQCRFESLLH